MGNNQGKLTRKKTMIMFEEDAIRGDGKDMTDQVHRAMNSQLMKLESYRQTYRSEKFLGGGAFGRVYLCSNRVTGERYACKVVIIADTLEKSVDAAQVMNEIKLISRLDHPNIVKFHEVFARGSGIFVVMELLKGGNLLDVLLEMGKHMEGACVIIFQQVLAALKYIHKRYVSAVEWRLHTCFYSLCGIIHGDLKLENIMLARRYDFRSVKLIDFGMAIRIEGGKPLILGTLLGTLQYMAPEMLLSKADACKAPLDMWSCGVLLYIMLMGKAPYDGATPEEMIQQIHDVDIFEQLNQNSNVSDDAKDLIKNLLVVKPGKRLTASKALKHPWLLSKESDRTFALEKDDRSSSMKNPQGVSDDVVWEIEQNMHQVFC